MTDWQNAGLPLASVGQWTVHELNRRRDDPEVQVLDVRAPEEVEQGRVPDARHAFAAHLPEGPEHMDKNRHVAAYYSSGYRASIAARNTQRLGFPHVGKLHR